VQGLGWLQRSSRRFATPKWGVSVGLDLPHPPSNALIAADVDDAQSRSGPAECGFRLIPTAPDVRLATGTTAYLGTTFLRRHPGDRLHAWRDRLMGAGARQYAGMAQATVTSLIACPRPASHDGLPYLGKLADRLYGILGLGGKGFAVGPGAAHLVVRAILEGDDRLIPDAFRPHRR
jgi:glycine/D-amino acid oxidase-like deaminating enzyme